MLNKCLPDDSGLILAGSTKDSDLSIPILGTAKYILRDVLLNTQIVDPLSDLFGWSGSQDWHPENVFEAHYSV